MRRQIVCVLIVGLFLSSILMLNVSNAGYAWIVQTVDSAGDVGEYCSLALDSSDNLHISYTNSTGSDIKYAKKTGTIWTKQTVDSEGSFIAPSLALDSSDNPHISYNNNGNMDLKYAKRVGVIWTKQTVDSAGDVGTYPSLALDSSDNPHISYLESEWNGSSWLHNLKYARWTGSSWIIQTVVSADGGAFSSLALDSSDNPHISYQDYYNADLKYARWTGSSWIIQTVDSAGDVGRYCSLALDSSDNPHISYKDYSNGELKYAKKTGTIWTKQTVDSAGWPGYSSLALDSSDNPRISYHDGRYKDLKYARKTGTMWAKQTVDSAGDVGEYCSLALDSSDNPHITYYDATNGDLKYASWTEANPAGSIVINDNDPYTNSLSVLLSLTYEAFGSTVSQVRYSNDGVWDTEPWEAPTATKAWTLTSGDDGLRTVYYQIEDSDGMLSLTYDDTIILDTGLPYGYIMINSNSQFAVSPIVTLSLTSSDSLSGVNQVRYSNDGVWDEPWEAWEAPSDTKSYWDLMGGDGLKTVYYQVMDNAGNIYQTWNTITLDTTDPTGSIVINGGAASTTSASVTLSLTYADDTSGVIAVRYSNDGVWDTEPSEMPTATKAWTLSGGSGEKTVYYRITNNAGRSGTYSDTIELITTAPYGSIVINGDDDYATSASVTLSLTYAAPGSTVSQVRYSNDGVWDTEPWEAPAATKAWTLTSGDDGERTVYYQVKNAAEVVSSTYSDTIVLDTSAPTGSIVFDEGEVTSSVSVSLTLYAEDAESGVSEMRLRNSGGGWFAWEAYSTSKDWVLTSGDGTKTVEVKFKNGAGLESSTFSGTITLAIPETDTSPPTGTIMINGGSAMTSSASVTLTLYAEDAESGVAEMCFSDDGVSWSGWEPYATSKSWTLPGGLGTKTVFVQFKNGAGLESISYNDSIDLVGDAPDFEELRFYVNVSGVIYIVDTCSNSSVSDVTFNPSLGRLRFNIDGAEGTAGLCNITFIRDLMRGDFSLYLDDVMLVEGVDYVESFDGAYYTFSINYVHSSHVMAIFSTIFVPDFAGWLFLPFLMLAALVAFTAKLFRKRRTRVQSDQ